MWEKTHRSKELRNSNSKLLDVNRDGFDILSSHTQTVGGYGLRFTLFHSYLDEFHILLYIQCITVKAKIYHSQKKKKRFKLLN